MKQKTKIISALWLCLAAAIGARGQENALQILPTTLTPNGKAQAVEVQMNNVDDVYALQFDIYLPDGIALRSGSKPYGSLPKARFPYTEEYDELEDVTTTTFEHGVDFLRHDDDGFTRFAISPNSLTLIKGHSGTVLRLYVVPEDGLADGFYPIKFDNMVFTKEEGNKYVSVRPEAASSFVIVGEHADETLIDLSGLTGYVPKDVCDKTTEWLSGKGKATEIDLSNVADAGGVVTPGNPNAVVYVGEDKVFAAKETEGRGCNVVSGAACSNLVLTDGYPFAVSRDFSAATATYKRTVPSAGWYSLCLPFAAPAPNGVTVERYQSYDEATASLAFGAGNVEANKPFIYNTTATDVEFTATGVAITPTSQTTTDGCMIATYQTIEAGGITGKFALHPDGRGFGQANETAYVPPFHAYADVASNAKTLKLFHGETTKIATVEAQAESQSAEIYTIDGRKAARNADLLSPGVYIINKEKIVIR